MPLYQLKYGENRIDINVNRSNLYDALSPCDIEGVKDPIQEVNSALENPIESPKLKNIAAYRKKAVILASDITRPSPSHILLPPIIDELLTAGLGYDDISIVFGLGYHRKHTEEEKKKLVGEDVYKKVKCIDHDINECVYMGTTKHGTKVEVFKPVAEAGLIVATGNIELHYLAGYSGGDKALLPGVCSKKTIETNHAMMIEPGTMPGKINDNPVREDIEEAGRIAGVDFIVNAVLNSKSKIVKVVAGDPVKAHREGSKCIDRMYKRNIVEKVDIVVASCGGYPKDINLYQSQKGLENASYAVKDGGSIILLAECREGLGETTFEEWMVKAKSPSDPIEWIQKKFVLGAHKAAVICMVLKRVKVYLVSKIAPDLVKDVFFIPADSAQKALDMAVKEHGNNAKVLVLPYANSTLPYVV
jgi:nickel-dependent lactate racemase